MDDSRERDLQKKIIKQRNEIKRLRKKIKQLEDNRSDDEPDDSYSVNSKEQTLEEQIFRCPKCKSVDVTVFEAGIMSLYSCNSCPAKGIIKE